MRRFVAPALAAAMLAAPAVAAASPELSTTDQLNTRRYVAAGERAYVMGFQDGSFQAQGWHITGEMGGVWSQPLKLVDGVWFGLDDAWLPAATTFTSGWGYTRMDFPDTAGLKVSRTDLGPGPRALTVVPQVPPHEPFVAGENLRLGDGALRFVKASRYRTEVDSGGDGEDAGRATCRGGQVRAFVTAWSTCAGRCSRSWSVNLMTR